MSTSTCINKIRNKIGIPDCNRHATVSLTKCYISGIVCGAHQVQSSLKAHVFHISLLTDHRQHREDCVHCFCFYTTHNTHTHTHIHAQNILYTIFMEHDLSPALLRQVSKQCLPHTVNSVLSASLSAIKFLP